MISRLVTWIEHETGLSSAWSRFWRQRLPSGLKWGHVLGALLLLNLVVLFATGGALMFFYSPDIDQAYASIQYIEQHLPFGSWVRALHYWTARLIVLLMIVHLLRVFFWAAYKRPRQMIWVTGVIMLLLVIGFGITGYTLPWDQNAYWATVIRLKITEGIPFLGPIAATFLRGGQTVGAVTLVRFYVLHVFLLPITIFVITAWHIRQVYHLGVAPPRVRVGEEKGLQETVPLHPHHTSRIAVGAIAMTVLLAYFAHRFPAPLEARADPFSTAYQPHPDFYVLWLHALLDLFPRYEFIGSFVLPMGLALILLVLPFLDRSPERDPRRRWRAVLAGWLITAAIVGLTIKDLHLLPHQEELSPMEEQGQRLFVELQCHNCHGVNGMGGGSGPDLGLSGGRDADQVRQILANPTSINPHTIMSGYELSPSQREALVAYIMGIGPSSRLPAEVTSWMVKPASHLEQNWPIQHKFEVSKDPESCNNCHQPFFCQACHQRRRPSSHQDPRWLLYHYGTAAEQPKVCQACHTPDYCQSCHEVLRHDTQWLSQHGPRLAAQGEAEWSGITMKESCYQCHSQQSCQVCHQGAVPASHLEAGFLQSHGRQLPVSAQQAVAAQRAGQGPAMAAAHTQTTCSTCHSASFCDSCHRGAQPASHQNKDFLQAHGRSLRSRDDRAACATCHEQSFCDNCHGLPMPHPARFASTHPKTARVDHTLCLRCHQWEQNECRSCHNRRPASHTQDFRQAHPQRIDNTGDSCQVCHGRNACADCHGLPMPHPAGFVDSHKDLARERKLTGPESVGKLQAAVCSTCHQDSYCRICHLPEE